MDIVLTFHGIFTTTSVAFGAMLALVPVLFFIMLGGREGWGLAVAGGLFLIALATFIISLILLAISAVGLLFI